MIRSRAAASRAPAAPLRGRFAPPDPAARSQEPAAIRAREHSEARPKTVNGPTAEPLAVTAAMQVSGQRPGEGAVRGSACFGDLRPFCPVMRAPGLLAWLVHAVHPGRPVLHRATPAGRRAGLVRALRPGKAAGSARVIPSRRRRGGDRVRAARRRIEDWPGGAVASDAARGYGRSTSGVDKCRRGVPGALLRTGSD